MHASMLADLHRLLALFTAAAAGVVLLVVLVEAVTHRQRRFARDRAILAAVALVAIATLVGLLQLASGSRPDDLLHLLYAAVALLVLPVVRFWGRLGGRRTLAIGAGAVILALLLLRLFQTG
jgi:hypothetical protein